MSGLSYRSDFISSDEEKYYIDFVESCEWSNDLYRKTQQYGFKYNYLTRSLIDAPAIPDVLLNLVNKVEQELKLNNYFNQIIVNHYNPGQGISKHTDHTRWFDNTICVVSLGGNTTMVFYNGRFKKKQRIERKSLMVMSDDIRYNWQHEIKAQRTDLINNKRIARRPRISITFRRAISNKKNKHDIAMLSGDINSKNTDRSVSKNNS